MKDIIAEIGATDAREVLVAAAARVTGSPPNVSNLVMVSSALRKFRAYDKFYD